MLNEWYVLGFMNGPAGIYLIVAGIAFIVSINVQSDSDELSFWYVLLNSTRAHVGDCLCVSTCHQACHS